MNTQYHLQSDLKHKIPYNQAKYVQDLCTKTHKTSMTEIKEDLYEWRDVSSSWIVKFNIIKMIIFSLNSSVN